MAETLPVYDSDQRPAAILAPFEHMMEHRALIRLLVVRDITVRYKRSALGVWWTLLNPLLTTAVLWVVFSQVFRFATEDPVPFVVYLLSGVIVVTFFSQGVNAVGGSIVNSSGILTKVYVPPEVFAVAAAAAAMTNFFLSMVPLLLIQVVVGVGIPWTVLLTPIPALALLALVTGVGLVVASIAVYFYDVMDLANVGVQLVAYLTPSFYPIEIVPEGLQTFIFANPLYSYLLTFRSLVYLGELPPWWALLYMSVTAVGALAVGVWTFQRSWKNLVVLL
ncbi:ABC transporter permease [soil metagenome]